MAASSSKRKLGEVIAVDHGVVESVPPTHRQFIPKPTYRADGLQVVLKRIKGLTDPDVLTVPFQFQCPPMETFSRSYSFLYTDYDTVSAGQHSRPGGTQLATISFQTLFVDYNALFAPLNNWPGTDGLNPIKVTRRLMSLLERGTPFELIIGQQKLWGTNDVHWGPVNENAATLRTLDVEERAGEVDARYVNVSFTEYRSPHLLRKGKGKSNRRDPDRGRAFPATLTITRESQGTLRDIAANWYGDPTLWTRIRDASGMKGFQGSRNVGEWVKQRRERTMKLKIPSPPVKTLGFGSPKS